MTNEELLQADPLSLSPEDFNKWENLQKRAIRANTQYEKQLTNQVLAEELQARLFKAKRDIKVANLENMEATIKIELIHDEYQEAVEKASAKLKERMGDQSMTPVVPMSNETHPELEVQEG